MVECQLPKLVVAGSNPVARYIDEAPLRNPADISISHLWISQFSDATNLDINASRMGFCPIFADTDIDNERNGQLDDIFHLIFYHID